MVGALIALLATGEAGYACVAILPDGGLTRRDTVLGVVALGETVPAGEGLALAGVGLVNVFYGEWEKIPRLQAKTSV